MSDTVSISVSQKEVGLPFDAEQQKALIGHAILEERFFRQVKDRLEPDWLSSPSVASLWSFWREFYSKYNRVPVSHEEFRSFENLLAQDQAAKNSVYSALEQCKVLAMKYGLDSLASQLTDWSKLRVCLRDLPQVANLLNSRKISQAENLLSATSREVMVTRFDGNPPAELDNWRPLLSQTAVDIQNGLTTGFSLLDRKLLPEGEGRVGLMPGDTTVVLAPTNAGKTSSMITIARHNVFRGKSVLFISREGREIDIRLKMLQCATSKSKQELFDISKKEAESKWLDMVSGNFAKGMTYISMNRVGLSVEEVVSNIIGLQARRKAETGRGYDMVVIDYPGLLTTETARSGKLEWRQIQDFVYRQFVQLALEENFHMLVAAQTNREGSKINRGHGESRLLTPEDISEAYAIAMSATNILTLNRDPVATEKGWITWYICKSRSSEVGWAVVCHSDYARATTHSEKLGGTSYRGTGTMSDRLDSWLKEYRNREVPEGYVLGLKQ